ncbi:hypothetical protein PIB30_097308 [Stylosanthes scabra]|uniref:CCHC-type domain-containing protein n=1 Tax=Stylosanthes scabra TaxID=79078 RepID=A0ABU6WYW6_9FABA|nr:hypothetical protein [Stylosanthes scabra]
MDTQVCGPRKYSQCGRLGHSRSRCPQRAGPSTGGCMACHRQINLGQLLVDSPLPQSYHLLLVGPRLLL